MDTENHPLITVITVVFNGEKTIESTIKSVINFKKKNKFFRYIIIDGNSTDNTKKILLNYDHEISYWISEPDKGIYDAMNKGWNLAEESHILFLGSGDKIVELPNQLDLINGERKIYYGKVMIGSKLFKSKFNYRFKMGNTLHHQALLIHKSASSDSPFDLRYKVYADYDFSVRLFKKGYKFIHLENLRAEAAPGGLSSTMYLREMLHIIERNFGLPWMSAAYLYYMSQILKNRKYKIEFG
jgi:glycosyltransferase involved in cell wall biosynthesis